MKLKKLLGFVLALAMVLSLMPAAFAAEGDVAKVGDTEYATLADALSANADSDTIVVELLADATLDITAWQTLAIGGESTQTITINGNKNTLTFNKKNSDWNHIATNNDAKLILNNITITDSGYNNGPWNRYDINFACDVELNNVTSTKALAFKADATLNTVTINENGDNYAIWVQANGQTVEIDGLTINSAGRGIKIDEQYVDDAAKVTMSVKNATFTTAKKAAIVVKAANGADITTENVDISKVTADSTNAVWVDEDSADSYGNVTVNDKPAVMENAGDYVATVGVACYTSLQEALNAAAAGTGNVTVEILSDIDLTNVDWNPVTVSAPGYPLVTVNGNGHKITGLNDMLFAGTWAGNSGLIINDLTIANSTIEHDVEDVKGTVGVGAFIGFPQASATITLKNCHLVNSTVSGGHWTGGLIGMAGGYNGNDGPVFMKLEITGCSVTDSTITGRGSVGGVIGHGSCAAWTNVVITNTTVTNNTIISNGISTNKAGTVMGTIGAAGQATTAAGQTKTGGASISVTESGNTVTSNGTKITTVYGRQGTETGVLVLTGGTYENYPIEKDVTYAVVGDGLKTVKNANGTYGVYDENYTPAPAGPSLYTITKAACENGKVTAQAVMAAQGSTIKVAAVPAEGYKVASLTVTDASGSEIEVVDGKIKMPASNITVSAVFMPAYIDIDPDNEHLAAICYMYENGLMVGTSTGELVFDGEVKMTRSQIAMILYNLAGEPETAYTGVFTDAPEGAWYTEAVEWAASKGIMVGVGDGTFAHNRQITVVEMAALIYRYAQCQMNGQCESADWATESAAAMTWCVENGILAEGTVSTDIADRYLAADVFYSVYNLLNK